MWQTVGNFHDILTLQGTRNRSISFHNNNFIPILKTFSLYGYTNNTMQVALEFSNDLSF